MPSTHDFGTIGSRILGQELIRIAIGMVLRDDERWVGTQGGHTEDL
jgi:hypothetical protein